MCMSIRMETSKFQSTPPARGATTDLAADVEFLVISIHAPREGGDIGTDAAVISD